VRCDFPPSRHPFGRPSAIYSLISRPEFAIVVVRRERPERLAKAGHMRCPCTGAEAPNVVCSPSRLELCMARSRSHGPIPAVERDLLGRRGDSLASGFPFCALHWSNSAAFAANSSLSLMGTGGHRSGRPLPARPIPAAGKRHSRYLRWMPSFRPVLDVHWPTSSWPRPGCVRDAMATADHAGARIPSSYSGRSPRPRFAWRANCGPNAATVNEARVHPVPEPGRARGSRGP
jgi:hypothetical protein